MTHLAGGGQHLLTDALEHVVRAAVVGQRRQWGSLAVQHLTTAVVA